MAPISEGQMNIKIIDVRKVQHPNSRKRKLLQKGVHIHQMLIKRGAAKTKRHTRSPPPWPRGPKGQMNIKNMKILERCNIQILSYHVPIATSISTNNNLVTSSPSAAMHCKPDGKYRDLFHNPQKSRTMRTFLHGNPND
jgi:hypothetical protein